MLYTFKTFVSLLSRHASYNCCTRRGRWEGNIKMSFKEISCDDMVWVNIARNKIQRETVVHAVIKPKFLWQTEEFLTC